MWWPRIFYFVLGSVQVFACTYKAKKKKKRSWSHGIGIGLGGVFAYVTTQFSNLLLEDRRKDENLKRDTAVISKRMVNSVHLDSWHAGICPVRLG